MYDNILNRSLRFIGNVPDRAKHLIEQVGAARRRTKRWILSLVFSCHSALEKGAHGTARQWTRRCGRDQSSAVLRPDRLGEVRSAKDSSAVETTRDQSHRSESDSQRIHSRSCLAEPSRTVHRQCDEQGPVVQRVHLRSRHRLEHVENEQQSGDVLRFSSHIPFGGRTTVLLGPPDERPGFSVFSLFFFFFFSSLCIHASNSIFCIVICVSACVYSKQMNHLPIGMKSKVKRHWQMSSSHPARDACVPKYDEQ